MPKTQKTSKEWIKEAAWALVQRGEKPNPAPVRTELRTLIDTTPSQVTLIKALDEFWLELSTLVTHPKVPDSVMRQVVKVWETALKESENNIGADRAALQAAKEEYEHRIETLTLTEKTLKSQVALQQQDLVKLEQTLQTKERSLAKANGLLDSLDEENKRLKKELPQQETRYAAFEKRVVAQYDREKTAREKLERQISGGPAKAKLTAKTKARSAKKVVKKSVAKRRLKVA